MEQLTAAVRAKLEPAEAAFLDEVGPLRIKSVVLEGTQCIEVLLFGQETLIEWDGTEADAVQIVSDHAESHAADIRDDYWSTGGWRDRTTFPPT